jgi:hypothetical protein
MYSLYLKSRIPSQDLRIIKVKLKKNFPDVKEKKALDEY